MRISLQKLEVLIKMPAILHRELQLLDDSIERELIVKLQQFTILATKTSFTKSDLQRMTVLARDIHDECIKLNPEFQSWCKLHHIR